MSQHHYHIRLGQRHYFVGHKGLRFHFSRMNWLQRLVAKLI